MKFLLLPLFCAIHFITGAQYVFNFSQGPVAVWSNPVNWDGGVVPPPEVTSVIVSPPGSLQSWQCIVDVDGAVVHSLTIKSNATLKLSPGLLLQCYNLSVEAGASLVVDGTLSMLCQFNFTSNGTVKVNGLLDDGGSDCPGEKSAFTCTGSLEVKGNINIARTIVNCSGVTHITNTGEIYLALKSEGNFSNLLNDGKLRGNVYLWLYKATNNGQIELLGSDFFPCGLYLVGPVINKGTMNAVMNLKFLGEFVNNGYLDTNTECLITFDSANILNNGTVSFPMESVIADPGKRSVVINNGEFNYSTAPGFSVFNMDLINSGSISGGNTRYAGGSVINKNAISLTAYDAEAIIDILVPFINEGTLTFNGTGATNYGTAFVNRGTIIKN